MPRPFINEDFTFTQPDGTEIQVRGTGNQRAAVFEDLNGYVVVRNPVSGYYQYAELDATESTFLPTGKNVGEEDPNGLGLTKHIRTKRGPAPEAASFSPEMTMQKTRWEQRIQEKREQIRAARDSALEGPMMAPPDSTTMGDYVGVCILIQFPDVATTIEKSEVDDFCNLVGYTGFGNNGSVHDYFLDVSNGRLRYNNLVTEYYTAKYPRSHYTDETIANGRRARELIVEALDHLKDNGFNFGSLTTDSSGFIRALNVFYAGPTVNNWSKGLWPHAWHLGNVYEVAPGKKFYDYQFTDMGDELELGTFCHENGHMICDFPDLYDYKADGFRSSGIGDFCLMCAGGPNEKNPVRVGAYLNRMAGWAESVTNVSAGLTGTLSATNDEFLIHAKTNDEYFVVEHRKADGRDEDLPASGMAIWHVDHEGNNEHQGGTALSHYECALEQADGFLDMEKGQNRGDAGDLFNLETETSFGANTNPNSSWWDGTPSGFEIHVTGIDNDKLSFRVPPADGEVSPVS